MTEAEEIAMRDLLRRAAGWARDTGNPLLERELIVCYNECFPLPPPAPKRLGLLTDAQLSTDSDTLRGCSERGLSHSRAAHFLDAARTLAGEITPERLAQLANIDSILGAWGYTPSSNVRESLGAVRDLLVRLAGRPAMEEPNA